MDELNYDVLYTEPGDVFWNSALKALERDEDYPVGFDTEFYNVDIRGQSCFARSKLHLMSFGLKRRSGNGYVLSPRGFDKSDAIVMPRSALADTRLRAWFASNRPKAIHNAGVDVHTLANEGIELVGAINTLALARWTWPERARGAGFTLDSLGRDLVGVGKTESFKELFQKPVTISRSTWRTVKCCQCGTKGCRKRSTSEGHARLEEQVETVHFRDALEPVPLEQVVPGHELWARALRYSAQDAILALAVYDLAQRALRVQREVPWYAFHNPKQPCAL